MFNIYIVFELFATNIYAIKIEISV